MRDGFSRERLRPSLLDRLTDLNPEEPRESVESAAQTGTLLKECVRRDLAWLFNTIQFSALTDGLREYPEVGRSVVNFGIPDLAGKTLSSLDTVQLQQALHEVLWVYEPRLLRRSVKLRVVADKARVGQNAVVFFVDAELWSQPVPLPLRLRTEINLEDGSVRVEEVHDGES